MGRPRPTSSWRRFGCTTQQAVRRDALGEAWHEFDLVIDRGDERPWIPTSFSRRWRSLAKMEGMEWVTFKTVRLGYNSLLRALGADGKLRALLMGHTRVQTGDHYYIDIDPMKVPGRGQAVGYTLGVRLVRVDARL